MRNDKEIKISHEKTYSTKEGSNGGIKKQKRYKKQTKK